MFLLVLFIALREVHPPFFVKILFIGGMGASPDFWLEIQGAEGRVTV